MAVDVRKIPFTFKDCTCRRYNDATWRLYDSMGRNFGSIVYTGDKSAEEIAQVVVTSLQTAEFPPPPPPVYDVDKLRKNKVTMVFLRAIARELGCDASPTISRPGILQMIAEKCEKSSGNKTDPVKVVLERWQKHLKQQEKSNAALLHDPPG